MSTAHPVQISIGATLAASLGSAVRGAQAQLNQLGSTMAELGNKQLGIKRLQELKHQASVAAARAKYRADEEIAELEHALELKRAELKQIQFNAEAELARRRIEDELARSRLRLAFEKEELEVLLSSPELLMLTPQAARLAEASQTLKNARTVIALTPQDVTASGSALFTLFRNLLQKHADGEDADAADKA